MNNMKSIRLVNQHYRRNTWFHKNTLFWYELSKICPNEKMRDKCIPLGDKYLNRHLGSHTVLMKALAKRAEELVKKINELEGKERGTDSIEGLVNQFRYSRSQQEFEYLEGILELRVDLIEKQKLEYENK